MNVSPATVEKKEIEVQLMDQGDVKLYIEQPQKVTFRLHNQTSRQMKLQLSVNEATQSDILICGCYPQILGKLEAYQSIDF
jgi:hypothetical protein